MTLHPLVISRGGLNGASAEAEVRPVRDENNRERIRMSQWGLRRSGGATAPLEAFDSKGGFGTFYRPAKQSGLFRDVKERLCHTPPEIFNPVNTFRAQPPSERPT